MSNPGRPESDTPDFSFLSDPSSDQSASDDAAIDSQSFSTPDDAADVGSNDFDFSGIEAAEPGSPPVVPPDRSEEEPAAPQGNLSDVAPVVADDQTSQRQAKDSDAQESTPSRRAADSAEKARPAGHAARKADSSSPATAPQADAARSQRRRKKVRPVSAAKADTTTTTESTDNETPDAATVPRKTFVLVAGYAAAITILMLLFWLTGRLQLSGVHPLESLPDVKPLQPGEFQKIPDQAQLPSGHTLQLGQTARFGDVEITPLRVTREVLTAQNPARKNSSPEAQSDGPVLKLWFRARNVSEQSVFAPWDLQLMCLRSPEYSVDESTLANSWLLADPDSSDSQRILNFMHPPGSLFQLTKQNSGLQLQPGEEAEYYVACADDVQHLKLQDVEQFQWRIQIRKGISRSGNGVTTMIDCLFEPQQIADADSKETPSA
ncbi:MAG: hypothetical protein Fues2KO_51440 [Fuerstiella sp.]